ncbi:MAG TPA: enolase C-terminal domain-like protein [Caulobacteraceae bacterium]|nr:enolase C-terminal domain-like protein [Caulobacteraceae bacterium]
MKITKVVCTPYQIAITGGIAFGGMVMTDLDHVLVEIHTDEGLVGVGDALARPHVYGESQKGMVAAIEQWFAPALAGKDPFDRESIWNAFNKTKHNYSAKAALDVALFDIIGQACGVSCRRLLGGAADSLAVAFTCGIGAPEAVAEQALAVNAKYGIAAFKLKAGQDPKADIRMLQAVRQALPDSTLWLDPNEGYSGTDAVRVLRAGVELDLAWVEEPVSVNDRRGRRMAAEFGGVPVLGDDSCRTPAEVAREVDEGCVGIVGIKIARTGFTLSEQIHGYCVAKGVRMLIGSQGDTGVGTAASWHFGAGHSLTSALPTELCFFLELDGDIVEEPPQIVGGRLTYPERPGLGVAIDRASLRRRQN